MSKRIRIRLGAETAIAELQENDAPNLCKVIWNALPIEGPAHHAKICNHEVMFPTPLVGIEGENMKWPGPGDVGWWESRNTITIWYGKTRPLGNTALFAKIVENLDGFKKEGLKTWIKQGTVLRIDR